jgi:hypothetical protein
MDSRNGILLAKVANAAGQLFFMFSVFAGGAIFGSALSISLLLVSIAMLCKYKEGFHDTHSIYFWTGLVGLSLCMLFFDFLLFSNLYADPRIDTAVVLSIINFVVALVSQGLMVKRALRS